MMNDGYGCKWKVGVMLIILLLIVACVSGGINKFVPETWPATATP